MHAWNNRIYFATTSFFWFYILIGTDFILLRIKAIEGKAFCRTVQVPRYTNIDILCKILPLNTEFPLLIYWIYYTYNVDVFQISLFVMYFYTYLFQMMFICIRIIRVGCGVYLDTTNFLNSNEVVFTNNSTQRYKILSFNNVRH